jgi:hypothetical protein
MMSRPRSSLIFWGLLCGALFGTASVGLGLDCTPLRAHAPVVLASSVVPTVPARESARPPPNASALGDGTFDQRPPYLAPPETLSRASGAPEGKVSAPAYYASRAVYPGKSFEYEIYVPAQYDPKNFALDANEDRAVLSRDRALRRACSVTIVAPSKCRALPTTDS